MNKDGVGDFHRRLQRWYGQHGRKTLPWRNTSDAYAIYVSEIMLQQTQVATVLERYYFPFLKRFPTLAKLAAAKQDAVLSAWQGLGYYNRALNLHKAAKQCGKALPVAVEELLALPGIGRNTAHAVAAFAYHEPVAVMEANVRRVVSRIFALAKPDEAKLWDYAGQLLDKKSPFDYNQAMMDIGATICTRRAPKCRECPAQSICKGQSSPESYPAPKVKKTTPVRKKRIIVFGNEQGHYYAAPRTGRFLNGLYHFVEVDADAPQFTFQGRRYTFSNAKPIGSIRQQYSHFTLEADIGFIKIKKAAGKNWHSHKRLKQLPVSMAEVRSSVYCYNHMKIGNLMDSIVTKLSYKTVKNTLELI